MPNTVISTKTLTLSLRPLTPIHVWSGRKLFMGLDIIRKGADTLCVADIDRIPPHIVNKILGTRVEDMPKILERHVNEIPCRQELKTVVSIPLTAQVLELNPYIVPGSTLKGYIRTSILFHMLKALGDKSKIVEVLRSEVDLGTEPKRVAERLEARFFRAPRPQKQRGFVDSFQSLLVSDPEVSVDRKCYAVSELLVHEFGPSTLKPIASQLAVTVMCGELRYRVDVMVPKEDILQLITRSVLQHKDDVKKLRVLEGVNLVDMLREFGCYILSREIEKLRPYKELGVYVKALESFREKYCVEGAKCTIARLGFMAGHIAKTVLGLVKEVDYQLYQEIRSFMESRLHHVWDELTVKLVKSPQGLVGPGWCELCPA